MCLLRKVLGLLYQKRHQHWSDLNLNTKCISTEYHVIYDKFFTTVKSVKDAQNPALTDIDWDKVIQILGTDHHFDQKEAHLGPPMYPEWDYPPASSSSHSQREKSLE
eukprot:8739244-Ditylum_brightwellii.AAC.1